MLEFKRTGNAFNYVFERELKPSETIIIEMPKVSPNKRGINDIGWQSDNEVTLYGTLSSEPESDNALWQEIYENSNINKTVTAIKVVNRQADCNIVIRAILN